MILQVQSNQNFISSRSDSTNSWEKSPLLHPIFLPFHSRHFSPKKCGDVNRERSVESMIGETVRLAPLSTMNSAVEVVGSMHAPMTCCVHGHTRALTHSSLFQQYLGSTADSILQTHLRNLVQLQLSSTAWPQLSTSPQLSSSS